jgi:hypothetical protein
MAYGALVPPALIDDRVTAAERPGNRLLKGPLAAIRRPIHVHKANDYRLEALSRFLRGPLSTEVFTMRLIIALALMATASPTWANPEKRRPFPKKVKIWDRYGEKTVSIVSRELAKRRAERRAVRDLEQQGFEAIKVQSIDVGDPHPRGFEGVSTSPYSTPHSNVVVTIEAKKAGKLQQFDMIGTVNLDVWRLQLC